MSDSFIELKNVTKTYHQGDTSVVALDRLDLRVREGEFLAVTGKSGCGKSTLINIIGGLDSPDHGQVVVKGEDLGQMDDRRLTLFRRDRVGIIFQFFNLLPILTLEENIALPFLLKESSNTVEARVDRLLRQMDLLDRRTHRPHELSGGEMQRVAICRALVNDPEIILADEPTGNLDSSAGSRVLEILRRLKKEEGKTILLVTHSQEGAAIADRILRMQDGRLLQA
jgi:putative ABC transport system ATP-binding protein